MNISCFVCGHVFQELPILVKHFKLIHGLGLNSDYRCIVQNCTQLFSNLNSFQKHTKKHFSFNLPQTNLVIPNPVALPANITHESDINTEVPIQVNIRHELNDMMDQASNVLQYPQHNSDYSICKALISKQCEQFSINFHTKSNITRKDVLFIQKEVSAITSNITQEIKNKILHHIPELDKKEFVEFLSFCGNPFDEIKSEYKLFKSITESDRFAKPIFFNVNNEISEIILNNEPNLDASNVKGCIMPIEFQFRKFFELPSILTIALYNINKLSTDSDITHFVNSASFAEKSSFYSGKTIIPYFIYLDSFEINNPLGSHASVDSVCGVYYSFPTLPQYLLSNLNYIFVAAYFKSKDQKIFGNDPFLRPLIEKFRNLEENGLLIRTETGSHQIHFVMCNILGDNLGLNDVLGFTTSFNSNYYCRFCKRQKN